MMSHHYDPSVSVSFCLSLNWDKRARRYTGKLFFESHLYPGPNFGSFLRDLDHCVVNPTEKRENIKQENHLALSIQIKLKVRVSINRQNMKTK